MTKETYDRLQEISPPLPDSTTEKYRAKLKDEKDIAVPEECNGLERIIVYTEPTFTIKSPVVSNEADKGDGRSS
jgi:hypothetical protein